MFWLSYIVLWILVLAMCAVLYGVVREHLPLVMISREGRTVQGPKIGTDVPSLSGIAVWGAEGGERGKPVMIDHYPRRTVILFMGVRCRACWDRVGVISKVARQYKELDWIVSCQAEEIGEAMSLAGELHNEMKIVADLGGKNAGRWGIMLTPFAISISQDGLVRGKVAEISHETLTALVVELAAA